MSITSKRASDSVEPSPERLSKRACTEQSCIPPPPFRSIASNVRPVIVPRVPDRIRRSCSSPSSSSAPSQAQHPLVFPPSLAPPNNLLDHDSIKTNWDAIKTSFQTFFHEFFVRFYEYRCAADYQLVSYGGNDLKAVSFKKSFVKAAPALVEYEPELVIPDSVDNVDIWKCALCLRLYNNPITTHSCSHAFCASCIDELYKSFMQSSVHATPSCPECRAPLPRNRLVLKPQLYLARMINSIKIQCPNQCGVTTTVDRFRHHHAAECANAIVVCQACLQEVKRSELSVHMETCEDKLVECDLCHVNIPRKYINQHIIPQDKALFIPRYCENMVPCPFGCVDADNAPQMFLVTQYLRHHHTCSKRKWVCPFCDEEFIGSKAIPLHFTTGPCKHKQDAFATLNIQTALMSGGSRGTQFTVDEFLALYHFLRYNEQIIDKLRHVGIVIPVGNMTGKEVASLVSAVRSSIVSTTLDSAIIACSPSS